MKSDFHYMQAWLAIYEHIKETYIEKTGGSKHWYALSSKHSTGIETVKAAIDFLAKDKDA